MSKENQQTLAIYEQKAEAYLEGNEKRRTHHPSDAEQKRAWLRDFLRVATEGMLSGAQFFEFGSADGDAVELFKELGLHLTPSDAPISFVEIMRGRGLEPVQFDVLQDDFPGTYDGVYSWRTLVHFTADDVEQVFQKVFATLKPGGRYIFNMLNSYCHDNKDEDWVDFDGDYKMGVDRYFKYWYEDDLKSTLKQAGFKIKHFSIGGGADNQRWFYVVAEKPEEK